MWELIGGLLPYFKLFFAAALLLFPALVVFRSTACACAVRGASTGLHFRSMKSNPAR